MILARWHLRVGDPDAISWFIVFAYAVAFVLALGAFRRVSPAIAGISMLVVFVIVRAASFHYVDKVLALGGSVRINHLLELTGIGMIVVAALVWRHTEGGRIDELTQEPQENVSNAGSASQVSVDDGWAIGVRSQDGDPTAYGVDHG